MAPKPAPQTDPDTPAEKPATAKKLAVGQLVDCTAFDHYAGAGGEDVTRVGLVTSVVEIEVTDEETGKVSKAQAATVSWLTETDPIPAEQLTVL